MGADFAHWIDQQIASRIHAGIDAFGAPVGGNQRRVHRYIDALGLRADADRLFDLEVQMVRRLAPAVHEVRDAAQNLALLDGLALVHRDRLGVHVEIVEFGAIAALQAHSRVRRDLGDDAIDDRDNVPFVVVAFGRADILALVTLSRRTHRHRPAADLAEIVALHHGVEVARIALAAARRALASPAAAAIAPDLGIHERMLASWVGFHARRHANREHDVRRVDLAIAGAAAAFVLRVQITWGEVGKTRSGHGGRWIGGDDGRCCRGRRYWRIG